MQVNEHFLKQYGVEVNNGLAWKWEQEQGVALLSCHYILPAMLLGRKDWGYKAFYSASELMLDIRGEKIDYTEDCVLAAFALKTLHLTAFSESTDFDHLIKILWWSGYEFSDEYPGTYKAEGWLKMVFPSMKGKPLMVTDEDWEEIIKETWLVEKGLYRMVLLAKARWRYPRLRLQTAPPLFYFQHFRTINDILDDAAKDWAEAVRADEI